MNRTANGRAKIPAVEHLEARALLSGITQRANPAVFRAGVEIDRIELMPLNSSGVTGRGTLRRTIEPPFNSFPDFNYVATLRLKINGLEAGYGHRQDLDGTTYLSPPATCPPASAAASDPSPAGLGDDIISASEAAQFTGGIGANLKQITAAVRTRPRTISLTFRGQDDYRAILSIYVVRGMTVHGQYEPTVPVACSMLTAVVRRPH
jgi:hypothetical protein